MVRLPQLTRLLKVQAKRKESPAQTCPPVPSKLAAFKCLLCNSMNFKGQLSFFIKFLCLCLHIFTSSSPRSRVPFSALILDSRILPSYYKPLGNHSSRIDGEHRQRASRKLVAKTEVLSSSSLLNRKF